jgi:uncharacterized protein YbaR (Trm112 family)
MHIDGWLLDILACPECHSPLRVDEEASELVCTSATCALAYPVRDDIPVLLVEEARRTGSAASAGGHAADAGGHAASAGGQAGGASGAGGPTGGQAGDAT